MYTQCFGIILHSSRYLGRWKRILYAGDDDVDDDDDDGDDDVNCFASVLQPRRKLGLNTFLHREPETG